MMKRVLALGAILVYLWVIPGCQTDSAKVEWSPNSYSVDTSTFVKSMTSGQMFAYNNDYLVAYDGFLYLVDSETWETVIACNDPSCPHTDVSCGAYLHAATAISGEYEYYVDDGTDSDAVQPVSLYRRKVGGGQIEEIMPLMDAYTDGFGLSILDADTPYLCWKDSILYIYRDVDVDYNKLGSRVSQAQTVLHYDGPSSKIEFEGGSDQPDWSISGVGTVWNLWQDGEDIYIEGTIPTEASKKYYMQGEEIGEEFASMGELVSSDGYDTYKQTFYRFNPETKMVNQVWTCPDESEVGAWDTANVSVNGWYITDGVLYYFLSGNGVWMTNLGTGELERVLDLSQNETKGTASFDDDYIYINVTSRNGESKQLYEIYQLDGTFVAELDQREFIQTKDFDENKVIGDTSWAVEVLGSDHRNLFIYAKAGVELKTEEDLVQSKMYQWVYAIDKSNLTGTSQLLSFDQDAE